MTQFAKNNNNCESESATLCTGERRKSGGIDDSFHLYSYRSMHRADVCCPNIINIKFDKNYNDVGIYQYNTF